MKEKGKCEGKAEYQKQPKFTNSWKLNDSLTNENMNQDRNEE